MDEENTPARRGRPRGTGIDDTATLTAVADVLLASPGMLPTTAMKRTVKGVQPTQLRRLQEKWKAHGDRFRAEAGERIRRREEAAAKAAAARAVGVAPDPAAAWRAAAGMVDYKGIKAALSHMDLPEIKAILDMNDTPAMKAMRDMMDPPFLRHLRELENSPAMKLARDMERLNKLCDPFGRPRG